MASPDFKNRKTPGVYITEIPAFPPSVVGVATAIPVFVGYTQWAEVAGKPVFNRPILIHSLADFQQIFGGGYTAIYNLKAVGDGAENGGAAGMTRAVAEPAAEDNYDFAVLDDSSPPQWKRFDLTAAPVTSAPAPPDGGSETSAFDAETFALAAEPQEDPAPAQPRFNLYNSMRLFYDNGGGDCYVVSVSTYDKAGPAGVQAQPLLDGLAAAGEQVGPTMIVVPDAVLIEPDNTDTPWVSEDFNGVVDAMVAQAAKLQDRIAILDVYGSQYANASDGTDLETVIGGFRASLPDDGLSYAAAYFPFLQTSVIPLSDVTYLNIDQTNNTLQTILGWENTNLYAKSSPARYEALQYDIDHMYDDLTLEVVVRKNQNLLAALPVLKTIEQQVIAKNDVLPPSGAMAGVYTRVDAASGVWNAPANVTLASVVRPSLKIDNKQQEDLNLPVDGKAVDALRAFPGRGTVVWGARTLDGNSPDFRYVQVRRTLIYIEQSIKAALDPFVFAPNTGQTWATVVSMVTGFLTGVWSRGGLMGAKASDAFTVNCGLGSTMTGTDILDGYMIVQVTLAMIRPAEFIELTFKQTMQGVG